MAYYPSSPQKHRRRRSSAPQENPYHPRQTRHLGNNGNSSSNKRRSSAGQLWYPYHHDLPLPANDDEYYYEEHPTLRCSSYSELAALEDEPEWYNSAPHSFAHPYHPRQQQQQEQQHSAAAAAAAAAAAPPPVYSGYYQDPQPLRDREQVEDDEDEVDEDEDEDDAVSPQEQLAAENAIRNRDLAFQDPIILPKLNRSPSDDELSSTARPSSSGPSNAPLLPHQEEQQQQPISADAPVREPHPQRRRRRFSFGNLMKRITPKKLIKMRTHASIAPQRNIQTITSTGPTGDVLSEQQQQEIIDKLLCQETLHLPRTYSPAAAMITGLDCIWVFRLMQDRPQDMDVWTGFDMANQTLLSQKQQQESEGEGIEIFDSHIRQGQLPVLIIPERQLGYFPLDVTGNQIGTLQIACLPNNNEVQFVYRQQLQHASRF